MNYIHKIDLQTVNYQFYETENDFWISNNVVCQDLNKLAKINEIYDSLNWFQKILVDLLLMNKL